MGVVNIIRVRVCNYTFSHARPKREKRGSQPARHHGKHLDIVDSLFNLATSIVKILAAAASAQYPLARVLTSLYLATGTFATIYGTSTYILEPMLHNLTSARHSLFSTTNTNIETLNKKLEGAVSKVPPLSSRREEEPENDDEGDEEEDADSTISVDGARFFQRSAGTQTSPRRLSRSSSSSIIIAADPPTAAAEAQQSPAQEHTSALSGLHGKLSDLLPTTNGEPRNPLRDSIGELRAYLEKLPYANSGQLGGGKKVGRKGEAVDAVAKVKAEIRGVKGVLLSARNFPSGVAAR